MEKRKCAGRIIMGVHVIKCPQCGAALNKADSTAAACEYCGALLHIDANIEAGNNASDNPPDVQESKASGSPPDTQQIKALIEQGKYIEAVKLYRDYTGLPLKDAKTAVDNAAAELGIPLPKKSGLSCLGIIAGFLVWVGAIIAMPFIAEALMPQIFGSDISADTIETGQALLPLFFVFISAVIFFMVILRKGKNRKDR